MLPDYLRHISDAILSDREPISLPPSPDWRRYIIDDDPRTTFWGSHVLLQRLVELSDQHELRPEDWREKAKKFQAMVRGLRRNIKGKKGDIPQHDVLWQISPQAKYSPCLFLERLGVIAFADGVDGGELFFRLEWNGIRESARPIPYSLAHEFMGDFVGDEGVRVYDLLGQYAKAEKLIQEWVFFSRWLELMSKRERSLL